MNHTWTNPNEDEAAEAHAWERIEALCQEEDRLVIRVGKATATRVSVDVVSARGTMSLLVFPAQSANEAGAAFPVLPSALGDLAAVFTVLPPALDGLADEARKAAVAGVTQLFGLHEGRFLRRQKAVAGVTALFGLHEGRFVRL